MSGTETAKIEVWWDMNDCPIPEGYDARRVRPSMERAFEKIGYTGPVSITAYGDQTKTPDHHLLALSSTVVAVVHTIAESTRSVMYRDMVEWRGQNPPPATMMIISDQVEGDFSWDLARLQQRNRYDLFQANSMKSRDDLLLVYYANWRWEQLLEEGGAPPPVANGLSSAAMFYCKSCNFDCQSLNKFRKHLSSYKHGMEEAINPPDTRLSCVTKTWARNYPATPQHATAKIHVLWDMIDCPIPEGYDARRVRPSIESAFKEIGYSGPVSITAFADQKQTPVHHLLALSSTGVDFSHTLPCATLCKGLNRGLGTLIAGSLTFFIEFVANDSGKVLRAIFIGTAVFIIGAAATYIRFIPYIKKNYDYGVVIFLLTFNLITVSSYRVDSVITIAHDRFYTIVIGCGICLFMSLLVFPIWSGEDLHKTTVGKLQGLSRSIEACVSEYFEEKEKETSDSKDRIYEGYQAVLDSKSIDETLVNLFIVL
ncbi:hypothetical protein F2Q68_00037107 [Brassica cretica]|uniref:C2H2-type domain-containing protein n=1 Tax=Brassica cretica TaxID=69181 RepID=A0A8S9H2Y1_BRACR|nr:hypothetical protein F2Q68_00037107 [Brassica cretica]